MSRTRLDNMMKASFFIKFCFYSRLIIVLVSKIHIFSFPNQCRLLHTIDTRDNPRGQLILLLISKFLVWFFLGLCELSNNDGSLLVFPFNAKTKGGFVQFLVSKNQIDLIRKMKFKLIEMSTHKCHISHTHTISNANIHIKIEKKRGKTFFFILCDNDRIK